jgi:hypothetical protein
MAISRSSATRMSQEHPARAPLPRRGYHHFPKPALARLHHQHGRIVRRACPPGQDRLRQSFSTRS